LGLGSQGGGGGLFPLPARALNFATVEQHAALPPLNLESIGMGGRAESPESGFFTPVIGVTLDASHWGNNMNN